MRVETLMLLLITVAAFAVITSPLQAFVDIGKSSTSNAALQIIFDLIPVALGLGVLSLIWRGDNAGGYGGGGPPSGY